MNLVSAILLRCLLAFALVTGGIPALSMAGAPTSTDAATEAVSGDTDAAEADCHGNSGETSPNSMSEQADDDCCVEKEDDCTHEKCSCACSALTLVVPARSAPATLAKAHSPIDVLSAPAPQKVITTLLRPPRA